MKKILRDNNGSISALVVISVLLYSIVLTTAFMQASSKRKMQMEIKQRKKILRLAHLQIPKYTTV